MRNMGITDEQLELMGVSQEQLACWEAEGGGGPTSKPPTDGQDTTKAPYITKGEQAKLCRR